MQILSRNTPHKLSTVRIVGTGVNEIIHITEAFGRAEDLGLDLVLVSDEVLPPVVRIQDFKKLEYEKKKAKKANKASSSQKEIVFKINISDHDLATKVGKIQKFLEKGDKVKISVRLKGRERESPERGHELLRRVGDAVECKFNRIPGPVAIALLEPIKLDKSTKKPNKSSE